jgi:protein TonB
LAKWSWLVAVTASFLAVGVSGIWSDDGPLPVLSSLEKTNSDLDTAAPEAAMMVELSAATETTEVTPETVAEVQEVPTPVQIMEQPLDLPELAEALVTEDVFTIPTAPKIEVALRPVDPDLPKPEVRRVTITKSATQSPTGASSTAGQGTGSGGGGRGTFEIPKPSYPSSLRSLGIQGTVRLKIVVGASGRASSVSVVGTSGNSTLDQYAASWVRRNGKAPPGQVREFVAPLSFVIR